MCYYCSTGTCALKKEVSTDTNYTFYFGEPETAVRSYLKKAEIILKDLGYVDLDLDDVLEVGEMIQRQNL